MELLPHLGGIQYRLQRIAQNLSETKTSMMSRAALLGNGVTQMVQNPREKQIAKIVPATLLATEQRKQSRT